MANFGELIGFLDQRRKQLGMSRPSLAARSGISLPTASRILSGEQQNANLSTVLAMAGVLGVRLNLEVDCDVDDLLERQARQKAERLVGMVHGSAALEGQGLDEDTRERMVRRTVHELRAGSKRRLWAV